MTIAREAVTAATIEPIAQALPALMHRAQRKLEGRAQKPVAYDGFLL